MSYKICIVFLWLLLIISQLREVIKTFTWILRVQFQKKDLAKERAGSPGKDTKGESKVGNERSVLKNHEISESVTWKHCIAMSIVTLLRIFMLCWLCYVGLTFLGTQTDYIGLLMDGIALLFIIEVEEIVYARVLRQESKSDWEARDPIDLPRMGPGFLARRPDVIDLVWLLIVISLAISFQVTYNYVVVNPIYDALQCACLSQGEACRESHVFSKGFWDQYWTYDVPNSREAINDLMAGLPLNDIRRSFTASNASTTLSLVQQGGRAISKHIQRHLRATP
jgi:hypothetical protein